MHWLAVHLPDVSFDALDADAPNGETRQPSAILEAGKVSALSVNSLKAGAHIGMSLAAVNALIPNLIVVARQPRREHALMQRLALTLSQYTPWLAIEPDGIKLEITSTMRLFGGIAAQARQFETAAREAGVSIVRIESAATATAASILARSNRHPIDSKRSQLSMQSAPAGGFDEYSLTHKRLDVLPISALHSVWTADVPLLELLQGIGCRTLADLRALPRRGLTRRGGRELLDLVARAYGDAPDPQTWYEPPARFELALELMQRADSAASLVFAAQRLVQPLCAWLARQWLAASRLTLVLRHETSQRHDRHDQPESKLDIVLAEATRDAAQIMLLLRERLQRMTLPAPVYSIVLRLDDAASHAGRDSALWANATTQRASERALIDRLSARLGSERVQRLQLVADHRPERATRFVSAQSLGAAEAGVDGLSPTHTAPHIPTAPRPIWMLAEPLALREDGGRPIHEGRPLSIISRAERIESGWFDGAPVSRDYHVAASDNACWWIYRERHTGRPARWFLHGIFG